MKSFKFILLLLLSSHSFSNSILLKGGMVHSGTGEKAKLQDILIDGDVITSIGNSLIIDAKTKVIEHADKKSVKNVHVAAMIVYLGHSAV